MQTGAKAGVEIRMRLIGVLQTLTKQFRRCWSNLVPLLSGFIRTFLGSGSGSCADRTTFCRLHLLWKTPGED